MNDKYCFCSQLYKGGYITDLQNCLYLGFKLRLSCWLLATVRRFRERFALAFSRLLLSLLSHIRISWARIIFRFDLFWHIGMELRVLLEPIKNVCNYQ